MPPVGVAIGGLGLGADVPVVYVAITIPSLGVQLERFTRFTIHSPSTAGDIWDDDGALPCPVTAAGVAAAVGKADVASVVRIAAAADRDDYRGRGVMARVGGAAGARGIPWTGCAAVGSAVPCGRRPGTAAQSRRR